ncbi:DUF2637 domain-containing protein [Nonomuraea sp. NPDC046570]|uniref:DUF2637 domain-containing protein n=1 Tax=Nonomuraea sp. NPDC046570 TaxID=3155255 RepID=UPI0033C911F3
MDVTPLSTLRRLGIALAGLAVAALTFAACALSFDGLRALAVHGRARTDLAYLYPAAFDALLAVALISVLLLRSGRLLVRAQAGVVLILLILAAATVNVMTPLQIQVEVRQAAIGVAVAPWVMLAVALWLWLVLIKHVQSRRVTVDEREAEDDIVPFHGPHPTPPADRAPALPLDRTPEPDLDGSTPDGSRKPGPARTPESDLEHARHELERTSRQDLESTPVVGPTPAPETPPVFTIPVSERVTRWELEPPLPPSTPPHSLVQDPTPPAPRRSPEDLTTPGRPLLHDSDTAPMPTIRETSTTPTTWETADDYSTPGSPVAESPAERGVADANDGDVHEHEDDLREPGSHARDREDADVHEDDRSRITDVRASGSVADLREHISTADAREDGIADYREQEHSGVADLREHEDGVNAEGRDRGAEDERRPVRWGDRTKPTDVLVHPRPEQATISAKDADTQPVRVFADTPRPRSTAAAMGRADGPDPEHGPEAGDEHERVLAAPVPDEDTPTAHEPSPDGKIAHHPPHKDPPSGRRRSTPLPPED